MRYTPTAVQPYSLESFLSRWLRDREAFGLGDGSCGAWRRVREVWKGRRAPWGVRNLAVRRRGLFVSRDDQSWVVLGACVVVVDIARVQSLEEEVPFEGVGILVAGALVMLLMRPPPSRASNAPRLVRNMVMVW